MGSPNPKNGVPLDKELRNISEQPRMLEPARQQKGAATATQPLNPKRGTAPDKTLSGHVNR